TADRVGRDVGAAYAVNTLGAIFGSFLAGFVVLPHLGLERGLATCAALLAASAALFIGLAPELPVRRRAAAPALAAVLILSAAAAPHWRLETFQAGLFRLSIARQIIEENQWTLPEMVYYRDGIATTVSVEKWGKTYA